VIAFLRGKSINHPAKKEEEKLKFGRPDLKAGDVIPTPSSPSRRVSEASGSVLNQSSGKKLTRLTGATESSSHSIDQEELEQFALHLNEILQRDKDLKGREAVTSENFFVSCQDGLLLSKLINDSAPETIDERVLNVGKSLNPFKMTENINVAINSAKAIGCSVVNIGPVDILEGREHLILGLVWQVIKVGLLAKISLQFHPELTRLLGDGETLEEFLKLPADAILLRWFNFQLKRANVKRRVNNFGEDLVDSECYLHLLNILSPENCSKKAALNEENLETRAEAVVLNAQSIGCDKYVSVGSILKANHKLNLAFVANLFNHFPGLEQLSAQEMAELDEKMFTGVGDRESRTFALWMNSLGVDPFINSLEDDLRDGRVLLQVIDFIKPGTVNWKRVHMKPPTPAAKKLTRFQALENTNTVVDLCKNFKFSLVGIQGADVTDGVMKLTLALVWQLMRQHIIETLRGLSSRNGREINDEDMINWSNEMIKKRRTGSLIDPIQSFKDASLKTGRYLLELLAAVNPAIVNFELVTPGKSEEDSKSNAKYAISVARKMGASIFLLPEDILNVQPKMILTFIGTIMAIHLKSGERGETIEE
jgi:plastin-1